MTLEKRWSNLQYELAQSGGKMQQKCASRWSTRAVACVCGLLLLCLLCLAGTYVLWGTTLINSIVRWVLTYRDNGLYFNSWRFPQYTPVTKVYVFNYTNTEAFLRGEDKKLRVEEIGPYTYTEALEKVNIEFNDDGTLSYNEKRIFTFQPEQSVGSEDDLVVVPNVPLISAMSIVRDKGFAAQLGLRSALWALHIEKGAFDTLRARDFFFGYSDRLYTAAQSALKMIGSELPSLGILSSRNGVGSIRYTIHSGARDYSLVDVVARVSGKPDLGAWAEPDCNRVDGAIGAIFFPEPVKNRSRLHLFHGDLCRRIDLDFQKELVVMGDLPAYRYAPPADFFANADENPDNACFANSAYGNWPSGVFLNAPCFSDSPVFVSYPRFYEGDPRLRQMVDGVGEPEREKHQFYMDVHPDLGIAMGVGVRFQANLMVRKASFVGDYLDAFEDHVILPTLWFETIIAGYDETGRRRTWHTTFTLRWAEAAAQYGLPLAAAALAVLAALRLRRCLRGPAPARPAASALAELQLLQQQQPLTLD